MEFKSWLEAEIKKAYQALSLVPKDDYLKARAAFARLKELNITYETFIRFTNEK